MVKYLFIFNWRNIRTFGRLGFKTFHPYINEIYDNKIYHMKIDINY